MEKRSTEAERIATGGDDQVQVDAWVAEALSISDADERCEFLDRTCGVGGAFRREVEAMLTGAIATVCAGSKVTRGVAPPTKDLVGSTLDDYRIVEFLGAGGFGEVYRAEQMKPIRRDVAIKVIKRGMDSREVVARFEAERQALAMMEHPNIARVFAAGTTVGGRPYFVMELARGTPITTYCDDNRLLIPLRLALFREVCAGVQHAHQKGILHRDLKPSNIVVVEEPSSGEAVPKIIDFGIAKSLQGKLTDATLVSQHAVLMGTPDYMSPEQVAGDGHLLDTRTDVYSLGVVLYELLVGVRPFEGDLNRDAPLPAILWALREREPIKPSARLDGMDQDQLRDTARARGIDAKTLGQAVRGDLDWIVMRSLEKERERRYQGVSDLARDLERYANHQPVEARPPGRVYRMRKFARRHRISVVASGLVILAMLAGLWFSLASYRREMVQRRAAEEGRARAQKLAGFILQDLQPELRAVGRQRDAIVRSAQAAVQYFEQLPPEMRDIQTIRQHAQAYVALRDAVGWGTPGPQSNARSDVYWNAIFAGAKLWRQVANANPSDAEAAAEAIFGESGLKRRAFNANGDRSGRDAYTASTIEELKALDARFPGNKSVQLVLIRHLRGRFGTAPPSLRDALVAEACELSEQLMRAHPGDDQLKVEHINTLMVAGGFHRRERDIPSAMRCYTAALDIAEGLLASDPSHYNYLNAARWVTTSIILNERREYAKLAHILSGLDYCRRLLIIDPDEPYWLATAGFFHLQEASVYMVDRRWDEAMIAARNSISCYEEAGNAKGPGRRWMSIHLSALLAARQGKPEDARRYASEIELGKEFSDPGMERFLQGMVFRWLEDWSAAETCASEALGHMEQEPWYVRNDPELIPSTHALLGTALAEQERFDAAKVHLESAIELFGRLKGWLSLEASCFPWEALSCLARVHQAHGDPIQAEACLEKAFTMANTYVFECEALLDNRMRAARHGWELVQVLDPADADQAGRRRAVLVRVSELLNDPESEGRITEEERGIRARVEGELKARGASDGRAASESDVHAQAPGTAGSVEKAVEVGVVEEIVDIEGHACAVAFGKPEAEVDHRAPVPAVRRVEAVNHVFPWLQTFSVFRHRVHLSPLVESL